MSRVEKNKERREKKRKVRGFARIVFIFTMIFTTSICLVIVDISANKMLGNETIVQKGIESLKQININKVKLREENKIKE